MYSTAHDDTRRWYRQFWPWFLIALPTAVVIASISTLVIAIKHADTLVAKDYYKEGLAINRYLAQDRRAAELGLRASGSVDGNGHLSLTVSSATSRRAGTEPTLAQQVKLLWQHPTDSSRDFTSVLIREDRNRYAAHLSAPISGRWYLTLEDFHAPNTAAQWRLKAQYQPQHSGTFEFRAETAE